MHGHMNLKLAIELFKKLFASMEYEVSYCFYIIPQFHTMYSSKIHTSIVNVFLLNKTLFLQIRIKSSNMFRLGR